MLYRPLKKMTLLNSHRLFLEARKKNLVHTVQCARANDKEKFWLIYFPRKINFPPYNTSSK